MKKEELRIGNWVVDTTCGVVTVDLVGYNIIGINTNGSSSTQTSFGNIQPIPLTEEWLLRFGFEENQIEVKLPHSEWHTEGCLTVHADGGCSLLNYTWEAEIELNPVQYIHQLQNLYFALTGQELTLK